MQMVKSGPEITTQIPEPLSVVGPVPVEVYCVVHSTLEDRPASSIFGHVAVGWEWGGVVCVDQEDAISSFTIIIPGLAV